MLLIAPVSLRYPAADQPLLRLYTNTNGSPTQCIIVVAAYFAEHLVRLERSQ